MKLEIKLVNTNAGTKLVWASEACSQAEDARGYFNSVIQGFTGSGKIVFFIRFIGRLGYDVVCVKDGKIRDGDNMAVWIRVPAAMNISGSDFEKVLTKVANGMSDLHTDMKSVCEELHKVEYKSKDVDSPFVSRIKSEAGETAFRYYGKDCKYQLHELLGDAAAQSYYDGVKCVFLVDKESGITCCGNCKDFTMNPIKELVVKNPPLESLGYRPYLNDKLWDKPIEFEKGCKIDVTWKRDGYKSVKKGIEATKESSCSLLPHEVQLLVKREWFSITEKKTGKPLTDAIIQINGVPLDSNVPCEDGKPVKIKVSCLGYLPVECSCNISKGAKIPIKLSLPGNEMKYVMKIDKEKDATVIVQYEGAKVDSVFRGYGINVLEKKEVSSNLQRLVSTQKRTMVQFSIVGMVATILICGAVILVKNNKDVKYQERIYAAAQYMKTNKSWTSEELSKYDCTKDLLGGIENYNMSAIANLDSNLVKEALYLKKGECLVSKLVDSAQKWQDAYYKESLEDLISKNDTSGSQNSDDRKDLLKKLGKKIKLLFTDNKPSSKSGSSVNIENWLNETSKALRQNTSRKDNKTRYLNENSDWYFHNDNTKTLTELMWNFEFDSLKHELEGLAAHDKDSTSRIKTLLGVVDTCAKSGISKQPFETARENNASIRSNKEKNCIDVDGYINFLRQTVKLNSKGSCSPSNKEKQTTPTTSTGQQKSQAQQGAAAQGSAIGENSSASNADPQLVKQ